MYGRLTTKPGVCFMTLYPTGLSAAACTRTRTSPLAGFVWTGTSASRRRTLEGVPLPVTRQARCVAGMDMAVGSKEGRGNHTPWV